GTGHHARSGAAPAGHSPGLLRPCRPMPRPRFHRPARVEEPLAQAPPRGSRGAYAAQEVAAEPAVPKAADAAQDEAITDHSDSESPPQSPAAAHDQGLAAATRCRWQPGEAQCNPARGPEENSGNGSGLCGSTCLNQAT